MLPLPALLHSLAPASLSNHLAIFRRDLMARFIDPVLQRPYSVSAQCFSHEHKLSLAVAPSHLEDIAKRFDNLSTILNFLFNNFFLHLPSEEADQFQRSLLKSVVNNALKHLLVPSLPSSFGLLPSFLKVLKRAVSFEDGIYGLLGNESPIKDWSYGVAGHYERRRRVDILEKARTEILAPDDVQDVFPTTLDEDPETLLPTDTFSRSDSGEIDAWGLDEPSNVPEDDRLAPNAVADGSWAFDESIKEADTWGLDEELAALPNESAEINQGEMDPDSADAWGWDDEKQADEMTEDNAWDDPWVGTTEPPASEDVTIKSPKAITRLERKQNGQPSFALSPPISTANADPSTSQRKDNTARESYLVPKRTQNIMKMVETVIDESKLFYASNLFGEKDASSPPGTIVSQSALSILDLYQAIYPIKHAKALEEPKNGLLFSNSCLYMAGAIQSIEDALYGESNLKERLAECRHNLLVSSDSWFDDTIVSELPFMLSC